MVSFQKIVMITNTVLAIIVNLICSSTTLVVFSWQKIDIFLGYRTIVITLSAINWLGGLVELLNFPVFIIPPCEPTFLLSMNFPGGIVLFLSYFREILKTLLAELLAILFIYRTVLVLRFELNSKLFLITAALLATPLPYLQVWKWTTLEIIEGEFCDYWCDERNKSDFKNTSILKMNGAIKILAPLVVVADDLIAIICCFILHWKFRNPQFSPKTRALQQRLNMGMLLTALVHSSEILTIPLEAMAFALYELTGLNSIVGLIIYNIITYFWQYPLTSIVILFSVSGTIRKTWKQKHYITKTPMVASTTVDSGDEK